MTKYREEPLTGEKWTRANRVTINNPYDGIPFISFSEESVALLSDGRSVNTPIGSLTQEFIDPTVQFNLVHPEDGTIIGVMTYQQLYVAIHSLYIDLAQKRDLAEIQVTG